MNPPHPPPRQLPRHRHSPSPAPLSSRLSYLNQPPSPSLSAALSNLTPLLHLANTTLESLPTATASPPPLLPSSPALSTPTTVSLLHPSSLTTLIALLLLSLYPTLSTIPSHSTHAPPPPLLRFLPTNSSDLCFNRRPAQLPRVLCIECADFNQDSSHQKSCGFSVDFIRFLPSEIWAIRSEIEAWGGSIPSLYSSRILRAILRLKDFKLLPLYEWIVANSPRYGVIIDFAMRDHVFFVVIGNRNFECPTLVKMVMWLASQFRILYGEVNGKFFAVDMLKECISESALRASLFPLAQKGAESSDFQKVDGEVEEPVQSIALIDGTRRDEGENIKGVTVGNSTILISQVAAAVAALHERSLIEEKIKALRNSRPLSAYQRNLEHAYMSKIADDERQKRPDYRPIIEHDGFLRQRTAIKVKTREELLAEERDYKRRRMSYRGKKLKRNTLEVMRDIIEEFMGEIKQAGGVDGASKAVEEMGALTSENLNTDSRAAGVSGTSQIPEENRGQSLDYRKDLNARHDSKEFLDDIHRIRRDSSWDHRRQDLNKNVGRVRHDKDDNYGSYGRQSGSHSREWMDGRENQRICLRSLEKVIHEDHARDGASPGNEIIMKEAEMSMSLIIIKEKETSVRELVVKERDMKIIGSMRTEGEAKQRVLVETKMKMGGIEIEGKKNKQE
ncbi:UNVERIFIED_CONTAM: U11/U12 small nuclear ribonucleoprotein [Sesamum calycinum]|uniref:U11/U12 small nuclear ribonucleoprotein n=1 Tax=Sesamum calycinum TaxID=2727403 RepID=A0AAW2IUU6_9LAMI